MVFSEEICPICGIGNWIPNNEKKHSFFHNGKTITIEGLHCGTCNHCGTSGYSEEMWDENNRIVKEFKESIASYISPSDVLSVREMWLISTKEAAKIFGVSEKTFKNWEDFSRKDKEPLGEIVQTLKKARTDKIYFQQIADKAGVSLNSCPVDWRQWKVFAE